MEVSIDPKHVLERSREWRRDGLRVGFVPTMGALHEGHTSLVRFVRESGGADRVVVSIFVNPTQFGAGEDLAAYPRDPDGDARKLAAAETDLLFLPEAGTIYRPGAETWVCLERLPELWCGASRPGHFRGVATVVSILFNIVEPDVAVFGEKDYQQLQVIRRMARDLHMPLEVLGAPTVREPDGLAMSSRNAYLVAGGERERAACLRRALDVAKEAAGAGERSATAILSAMREVCEGAGGAVDYAAIVDPETLLPLDRVDRPARALLAVQVGRARLLDNDVLLPG